jgi:drug/metabolite transporter (DMT)-like permease
MSDGRARAVTVLVFGACVIGLAPIFVRLSGAGPAATGFWRLVFALPLLALPSLRSRDGLPSPTRFAVLAGVAFALDLGFWHYGIANTSVAKASVLANLTPIVVTAAAWLFLHQRPAPLFLVAVAVSVTGAGVMALSRSVGATGPNPLLGDVLCTITSVWYALYFFALSEARRWQSASQVMFWSSLTGVPLMLASAWLLGESVVPATAGGWAACVALAAVHAGGQGSIAWALGRLPPATASVTVLVQPVVTTALGWLLFAELLSAWQAAGAVLALAGVVLAQSSSAGTKDQGLRTDQGPRTKD